MEEQAQSLIDQTSKFSAQNRSDRLIILIINKNIYLNTLVNLQQV